MTPEDISTFFKNALKDRTAAAFVSIYNRTVRDKEKISFGEINGG